MVIFWRFNWGKSYNRKNIWEFDIRQWLTLDRSKQSVKAFFSEIRKCFLKKEDTQSEPWGYIPLEVNGCFGKPWLWKKTFSFLHWKNHCSWTWIKIKMVLAFRGHVSGYISPWNLLKPCETPILLAISSILHDKFPQCVLLSFWAARKPPFSFGEIEKVTEHPSGFVQRLLK